MQEIDLNIRISSAIKKIRCQFPHTVDGRLMFCVVERAIRDLKAKGGYGARTYLNGEIYHAEICGVDSDWIRRTLVMAGIDYKIKGEI